MILVKKILMIKIVSENLIKICLIKVIIVNRVLFIDLKIELYYFLNWIIIFLNWFFYFMVEIREKRCFKYNYVFLLCFLILLIKGKE